MTAGRGITPTSLNTSKNWSNTSRIALRPQRRRALEQVRKAQDRIRDLLALGHKAGVSHQRLGNIVGLSDVMVAMIIKGKRWT